LQNNLPQKLINIIKNDSWVKYGVGIEQDLKILSNNYNLGQCCGSIELKNIALMAKINNPNLERLYNLLIGDHVKKSSSVCDWSLELTNEQLNYAVKDAIMSYQLGNELLKPCICFINDTCNNKVSLNNIPINFINNNNNNNNNNIISVNYIGKLNEFAQQKNYIFPIYKETLDYNNNKNFICECTFINKITTGNGSSKKKAKYMAALNMYNIVIINI
jgi:hypothetical protein